MKRYGTISKVLFVVLLTFGSGSCSAPGLNDFPGIHEETFNCQRICDKMRECLPATSDPVWDDCVKDCNEQGYSRVTADCVESSTCEDGYPTLLYNCLPEGDEEG